MKLEQAVPILRIFDEEKACSFYLDYLGFIKDWEYRHEAHLPLFMQISNDDCKLYLSEHHGDGTPGSKLRIECHELNEYLKLLQSKDYSFSNPHIVLQKWGDSEMHIKDSFGNELIFYESK